MENEHEICLFGGTAGLPLVGLAYSQCEGQQESLKGRSLHAA